MAEFNSKIKVSFINDLSRGAQTARKQLEGLSTTVTSFDKDIAL